MSVKNLLNEKYMASKLPNVCLQRKELLKSFDRSAENRLVFVSAPAGYGKTVSTQLWLAGSNRETIWIGLDGYDNTPSIFYKLFCKGILSVQAGNKEIENILASPSFASSPVEHTIRILAEFVPDNKEYALVLDDTHLVTNKELLKSGLLVRKRLPLSFVSFILTRNKVSEDYTYLIGDGRYATITSKDLAFTAEETQKFFIAHGRSITMEEAVKVHSFTDGWAIGINALALSGQIMSENCGVQILGNYIRNSIWDKWDERLKRFMIETSLTDEMPVQLCERLTGRGDSREVLEMLCETNSFVSRISENVYLYHNLFLEFLRSQINEYGINTSALYITAAEYYIEHGDYFIARHYARMSRNLELLVRVISHLNQFGSASLDEFVNFTKIYADEILSENFYDQAPFLYAIFMWENYLLGNAVKMEYYLDKLYYFLPVIAEKYPQEYENIIMKMSLDHRIPLSCLFKKFTVLPPFKYYHEGFQGSTLTHEMPFIHRSDRDYSELITSKLLDELKITYGQLFKDNCDLIISTIESGIYLEKNKAQEALEKALYSKNLLSNETRVELCFCAYIHLTAAYYAVRNPAYSDVLEEAENFINKKGMHYLLPNLTAFKTRVQLLNGNKKSAREWLDNYFVNDTESLKLYKIYQYFTTAKAYTVLGETDKAMNLIIKLKQLGTDFRRPLDIAEAGVLQAILEWFSGKKKEAQLTLEAVLTNMQPYGFIRVISIEGAAVLPILKRIGTKIKKEAYNGSLQFEYTHKVILAAYDQSRRYKGIAVNIKETSSNLSKQQKLIITLMSEGYSYLDAAEETGLSINTVKSHALTAYGKLCVHNSLDAVIKARELGIIG